VAIQLLPGSNHSKRTRLGALARADYKCEKCGFHGTDETLNIHHLRYRWRQERPEDLKVLCRPCHSVLHGKRIPAVENWRRPSGRQEVLAETWQLRSVRISHHMPGEQGVSSRPNRGRVSDPAERYWTEVTDCGDLEVDLNAPLDMHPGELAALSGSSFTASPRRPQIISSQGREGDAARRRPALGPPVRCNCSKGA
jgi:hypothetical protein